MSDVLQNADAAGAMYLGANPGSWAQLQSNSQHTQICTADTQSLQQNIFGYVYKPGSCSGSFIGQDSNCLGYFHLTGIGTTWTLEQFTAQCVNNVPSRWSQSYTTKSITISDGTSDRADDGHVVMPHTGYPVCCAILGNTVGGVNQWYAVAAGEASALDVSHAAAACGIGGNFCATPADDIEIDIQAKVKLN